MQGGVWDKWSYILPSGVWSHSGPVRADLKYDQPSSPQSEKSPMNVDNLENINLCVSNFHRSLGYGLMPGRPARSEQMEGAYQHCSVDVQTLG